MTPDDSLKDLEQAVELYHRALDSILKGDPEGYAALYSRREDVTLGNPFGPFVRGHENVVKRLHGAAANYRDGGFTNFERISEHLAPDLACIIEVESGRAKVGGGEDLMPVSVRCTTIFRKEGDTWRVVHRHADPITSARPAESVIQP